MKGSTVTVRLSDQEQEKLEKAVSSLKMDKSQYIRTLINGTMPKTIDKGQEMTTLLCKLYVKLMEQGLDNDDPIMEEMYTLCQTLS